VIPALWLSGSPAPIRALGPPLGDGFVGIGRCRARFAKVGPGRPPKLRACLPLVQAIPSVGLADGWTDSKRGHHDFQSRTEIPLTAVKVLQFRAFASSAWDEPKSAICISFSRIQAPNRASVPKRRMGRPPG
jgi:hypothetical protein